MSTPTDKRLTGDVDGSGAKKAPNVKLNPIVRGARLSPRAKKLATVGAGVLAVALIGGILAAGHHDGGEAKAPDDHPGSNRANVSGMVAAAAAAAGAASAPAAASAAEVKPVSGLVNQTPTPTGGQVAPDPAAAYEAWLKEQHYKMLEEQITTGQSAISADVGVRGNAAGAMPSATSTAMQTAASGMTPGALLDLQKSLAGQAAQGVASDPNRSFQKAEAEQGSAGGYLGAGLTPALGDHELFAGAVISATMLSGIDSSLPGTITALVRRTVYDSRDPSIVLIPQGARLIGTYSSAVQYGQSRVMVVWNELKFPNGASLNLKGMQGTDQQGEAGFGDQVDNHYLRTFGSAVLISLIGAGAQMAQPQNSGAFNTPSAANQATAALATEMNSVANNLLSKNLNIAPTITIRQGYTFDVLVNRTIILPAWRE